VVVVELSSSSPNLFTTDAESSVPTSEGTIERRSPTDLCLLRWSLITTVPCSISIHWCVTSWSCHFHFPACALLVMATYICAAMYCLVQEEEKRVSVHCCLSTSLFLPLLFVGFGRDIWRAVVEGFGREKPQLVHWGWHDRATASGPLRSFAWVSNSPTGVAA
jgi:hypothetical protein